MSISLAIAPFEWQATRRQHLQDQPDRHARLSRFRGRRRRRAVGRRSRRDRRPAPSTGSRSAPRCAWRKCVDARPATHDLRDPRGQAPRRLRRRARSAAQRRSGMACAPLELPLGEEEAFHGVADVLTEEAIEYDARRSAPQRTAARRHRRRGASPARRARSKRSCRATTSSSRSTSTGEIPTIAELERTLAAEVLACTEFPVLVGSGHTGVGVDRLARLHLRARTVAGGPAVEGHRRRQRGRGARPIRRRTARATSSRRSPTSTSARSRCSRSCRARSATTTTSSRWRRAPTSACTACSTSAAPSTCDASRLSRRRHRWRRRSSPRRRPAARSRRRASRCACNPSQPPGAGFGVALEAGHPDPTTTSCRAHSQRLVVEDPALVVGFHDETHQTVLRGVGDIHVAVALARLERKFGVHVTTEEVRVAYRETILASGQVEGKVKKQSGGHGQYAVVNLRVVAARARRRLPVRRRRRRWRDPEELHRRRQQGRRGGDAATGGAHGFPVVDVRVECYDGKTHSVDSSDMAFKTAAATGFPRGRARTRRPSSSSRSRCSRSRCRPISRATC